jgi:hypothetical protein
MRNDSEMVQACQDELTNALSMGNPGRIAQCRKWLAETKAHYEQAGGEQSLQQTTAQATKKRQKRSPQNSEKPLYCLPQGQPLRKPR